ncbi:beta strand repeat-containing protein [Haloferula sp.]|uniref:beta strand repeat-containing protein n=1 Tax=Haloferula sp. TaxID=2497595 RepID=UPI00329FBCB1
MNAVAPDPATNFNAFDAETLDGASAAFVGTLIDLDGDSVTGVGFSVTNNMGKTSGLTGVGGTSAPAPFDDATIYVDNYGGANVGNGSRPDTGTLPDGANLVFTFSGLNDSFTYTVSGGYDSDNNNFNTTWDIDGQSATTNSGGGDGFITLTGLSTDGSGNLEIMVTKSVQLFVAGVTLTAESTPIWQLDASGAWSTPANWSPSVPNAASAEAVFSDSIPLTGPLTASLDAPVTLGDLSFQSAQAIAIGGGSALTLDGGGVASVSASSGSHVISADVSLVDPLDVNLDLGSALDITGALTGSTSVTNSGAGQLTLSGDLSGHTGDIISDAGSLVVSGTGSSDIIANAGKLEVSGTGGSGDITINTGAVLSGEGSHSGTLNLAAGNSLIVDPSNGATAFTTGTLLPAGPVVVGFSSSPFGLTDFTVLNYTTYAGTVATDFVSPDYRITFTDTGSSITASVEAAATGIWTASDGTQWDNGVSANWTTGDTLFFAGDTVTFDDSGIGPGFVDVEVDLAPASLTFDNTSGTYVLENLTASDESISAESGGINVTGAGNVTLDTKLTGNTDITHSGAGILAIGGGDNANDFVGTITVDGGGTLQNGGTVGTPVANNLTSLGDFGNTFSFSNGSSFDITSGGNLDRGFKGYSTGSFVFGDGTTLTNSSGTTKRNAFDDELDFAGDVTIAGGGRIDIDGDIGVSGTDIVITLDNAAGSVIGTSNTGKSIAEWVVNAGTFFASVDTSFGDAIVTVNAGGSITGNVGGAGTTNIANAITLNGGELRANQNNTTSNYTGTVTVTDNSRIDPNNGNRTVILSGTLTESGLGGDLGIGNGTTILASTLMAGGFTGDFLLDEAGNLDLENGVTLAQDVVVENIGGNKQIRVTAGNSAEISGGITVNDTTPGEFDLNAVDAADTLTVSGVISGSGAAGVSVTGPGTVVLSGTNTYTGDTTVSDGALSLDGTAINDAGSLVITGLGTVAVTGSGDEVVDTLFIDGVQLDVGTYDSTDYPGIITAGSITVTTGPAGFAGWITGTFANGTVPGGEQGPDDDPDKDGIANLVEYALDGEDPTVSNTDIASLVGATISYTKSATATGITYAFELSTDLGDMDPWTEATGGGYVNDATTVSYTFTPGSPVRNFGRLQVTED